MRQYPTRLNVHELRRLTAALAALGDTQSGLRRDLDRMLDEAERDAAEESYEQFRRRRRLRRRTYHL